VEILYGIFTNEIFTFCIHYIASRKCICISNKSNKNKAYCILQTNNRNYVFNGRIYVFVIKVIRINKDQWGMGPCLCKLDICTKKRCVFER